MSQETVGP